jgi:arginyl-tRNA synthetase
MKPVITMLEDRISAAMSAAAGRGGCIAQVRPTTDPGFGDYQVNGVMALAKELKTNPKKLAERVVEKLDVSDICEKPEVADPGFINLRLKPEFVATNLLEINKDHDRLGIDKTPKPKTTVVDFSGPNIAKQMHVGHLRSTIIGDCICRLLEFEGHKVIRQNHIGDWGTQMGMVIMGLVESGDIRVFEKAGHYIWEGRHIDLETLENLYKDTTQRCEENSETARKAREWTVRLQSGDPYAKAYWQSAWVITLKACFRLYDRLGIELGAKDTSGESYYKDILPDIVAELKKKRLAVESDGAVCVFPEGFKDKEGEPLPVIVQKSDGAYLYATTDLAAIRYRVRELKADRIIYVTDARQQLHFEMVFTVARMAGWDVRQTTEDGRRKTDDGKQNSEDKKQKTELVHVTFGSVLGENGKPLKTREGENVKLKELLDEAIQRAKQVVEEKNPELPADKKDGIAKAVGIGAVKYADYSNNRTSDYVFSFDKMLAMDGNTAPYMQYAYARIKSIERKAASRDMDIATELAGVKKLDLSEPAELDLAKHLIRYGEAIEAAVGDYRPNYLTAYLYELAQKFSVFYTNCPVLDAGPDKRPTRLLLCDLTAKTIGHGLSELLGIEVVEQM